MVKSIKTSPYKGKPISLVDFARLKGCDRKTVYRYLEKNKNLDHFDEWRSSHPQKVEFGGELRTFKEIAEILGVRADTARRYYSRHGTVEGCGEHHTDRPWLLRYYNTLDHSIPLDRCIAAAGYRSIRQFCHANDLNESLVGCWRRGKPYMYYYSRRDNHIPNIRLSLLNEMTNFKNGISIPLAKIMAGTGCLEWELFPNIFSWDYYHSVYSGLWNDSYTGEYEDGTIELKERKRAVRAVLSTIPSRLRAIVELSYGIGSDSRELTLAQIGREYGLTRVRTRQLLEKAMQVLRSPSRMKVLMEVRSRRMTA